MTPALEADVRLHGAHVGTLVYERGGSIFHYDDDLLATDHRTLGQTFEEDPRRERRAAVGIPAWFANLLPEGALRRQILREMGGGNIGNYTLISRLGGYLPGAVTVHSTAEPDDDIGSGDDDLPEHPLRHSLAGVQLKFSLSTDRLSIRVSGNGGWWIVKLPDRSLRDLVANEYVTMRWLTTAGFDVPPVEIATAGAIDGIPAGLAAAHDPVYLIERFDRTPTGRIHVEDFAQVADVDPLFKYSESGATYDTLGRVIRRLTGEVGFTDYVRRLVAMLVTGNIDAHLKNWALRYGDGRTAGLAPVYDFHSLTIYSTYKYASMALSLNGERSPSSITIDDFRRLAEFCDADPEMVADLVQRTVHDLRTAWRDNVPEATSRFDALADHFTGRLETLRICQ